MGIGICLFLHWENGISVTGTVIRLRAKMVMGLAFCQHISGIGKLVSGIWKKMVAVKWDW